MKRFRKLFQLVVATLAASFLLPISVYAAVLNAKKYKEYGEDMGVVLLDVNWGRYWGCGQYENAQLINLKFELFPDNNKTPDKFSVIDLKTPSRLMVDPVFLNYGFLVNPGHYALTGASVKVANSNPIRVGYFKGNKNNFIKDDKAEGGTFTVGKGEVVYIGNFYLDCTENPPIPWRYYSQGHENFKKQVAEYKRKYKFLKDKDVIYRLFKTEHFGLDYELPPDK